MTAPSFPPLFTGEPVEGSVDPFAKACAMAALGCDAGTIVHNVSADWLRAAIVFAPEVPLEDAAAVLIACGVGFSNALGALAPPEVAVHLEWGGAIRVNGARAGRLSLAAGGGGADAPPDWLVVGLEVRLIPEDPEAPGVTPGDTSLAAEGCGEVAPIQLLEAWARHTLVWINRWQSDGAKPLHSEWRGMAHGLGEEIAPAEGGTGTWLGVDERFGMLLRSGAETRLIPLSTLAQGRA